MITYNILDNKGKLNYKLKVISNTDKHTPHGTLPLINYFIENTGVFKMIDKILGDRKTNARYKYSTIIMTLLHSQLANGTRVEDINDLSQKNIRQTICSSDTFLRMLQELKVDNQTYTTQEGNSSYKININEKGNRLLLGSGLYFKFLNKTTQYVVDIDTTIIEADKADSEITYLKTNGYNPLVAFVNEIPIYIEGRSGNASPMARILEAIKNIIKMFLDNGMTIPEFRIDAAGYQTEIIQYLAELKTYFTIRIKASEGLKEAIQDTIQWQFKQALKQSYELSETPYKPSNLDEYYRVITKRCKHKHYANSLFKDDKNIIYHYYSIITNHPERSTEEVYEFYNQRGNAENNFKVLKNDYNLKHLPCSYLNQNTVYMCMVSFIRICCLYLSQQIVSKSTEKILPHANVELKKFISRVVNVVGVWITHSKKMYLKLFCQYDYGAVFCT